MLEARFEQAGRPGNVGGVLEDTDGNRPVLAKDADIYFERRRQKYEQDSLDSAEEAELECPDSGEQDRDGASSKPVDQKTAQIPVDLSDEAMKAAIIEHVANKLIRLFYQKSEVRVVQ